MNSRAGKSPLGVRAVGNSPDRSGVLSGTLHEGHRISTAFTTSVTRCDGYGPAALSADVSEVKVSSAASNGFSFCGFIARLAFAARLDNAVRAVWSGSVWRSGLDWLCNGDRIGGCCCVPVTGLCWTEYRCGFGLSQDCESPLLCYEK